AACQATDQRGCPRSDGLRDIGAYERDKTAPPAPTAPGNQTKEATGPQTPVTYPAPTINPDPDGFVRPGAASCSPASGSSFPVGQSTVNCTETNVDGLVSAASSFTVTVTDTTPPTVTTPSNIVASTTDPTGKVEPLPISATDLVDGTITTGTCSPINTGSKFPIGVTTETCSVADAHNNTGTSGSFTVTINLTDTTPPVLSKVPSGGQTAQATSAAGAVV